MNVCVINTKEIRIHFIISTFFNDEIPQFQKKSSNMQERKYYLQKISQVFSLEVNNYSRAISWTYNFHYLIRIKMILRNMLMILYASYCIRKIYYTIQANLQQESDEIKWSYPWNSCSSSSDCLSCLLRSLSDPSFATTLNLRLAQSS